MCIHQILAHIAFHIYMYFHHVFHDYFCWWELFHLQYYRITKMYSHALRMQSQSKDGIAMPTIGQLEAKAIAKIFLMANVC